MEQSGTKKSFGEWIKSRKGQQMLIFFASSFTSSRSCDPSAAHGGKKEQMAIHGRKTKCQGRVGMDTSTTQKIQKAFR